MVRVTMGVFCHDWSIPGAKLIILTLLSYVLPMRIVSAPGGKHFIALAELLQEIRPGCGVRMDLIGNPVRIRNNTRCCVSSKRDCTICHCLWREGVQSGRVRRPAAAMTISCTAGLRLADSS